MASETYRTMAENIVGLVGGTDNITFFTHCITRLRFNVNDKDAVDTKAIEALPGALSVQWSGDQLQVIVGQAVNDAYRLICEVNDLKPEEAVSDDEGDAPATQGKQASWHPSMILDAISGCIMPLIPVLIGTGMLKVITIILQMTGLVDAASPTYTVLSFVADSGYYFLPIFVGASAAQRFNTSMGLGMVLGAMLIHPTFVSAVTEGTSLDLFGLPIYAASYASTIFPTIIAVYVMSFIERWLGKHTPEALRSLLQPLCTLIVMAPLTLCLIAPAGAFLGTFLADAVVWLYGTLGFGAVALMSAFLPFIIMTGMHAAFTPFIMQSFATVGYDPLLCTSMFISNFNQGAAALAVALKTKTAQARSTAVSAGITAILAGVTEPALYGVNMKYRTPLAASMVGSLVGAGIAGAWGVFAYAFAGSNGVFGLPIFIGNDVANLVHMIIAIAVGMVITFVLTLILYKAPGEE